MRVLVAFTHLLFGGLSTFNHSIGRELVRRGHKVDVWTNLGGPYKEYISADLNLVDVPDNVYDLIVLSNNDVVRKLDDLGTQGFRIYITHGLAYENDIPRKGMADEYVAISPFSHAKLFEKTDITYANYIPQGVDCERFKPTFPINERLTRVLSLVKSEKANNLVKEACSLRNVELVDWYKSCSSNSTFDIPQAINSVDAVVGWGRVVLETMACGRIPICFDINETVISDLQTDYPGSFETSTKLPGTILPKNIYRMGRCNFSLAAGYDPSFTLERMLESFDYYVPSLTHYYRNFAVNHYNITLTVDRLLNLYVKN